MIESKRMVPERYGDSISTPISKNRRMRIRATVARCGPNSENIRRRTTNFLVDPCGSGLGRMPSNRVSVPSMRSPRAIASQTARKTKSRLLHVLLASPIGTVHGFCPSGVKRARRRQADRKLSMYGCVYLASENSSTVSFSGSIRKSTSLSKRARKVSRISPASALSRRTTA